ncbi:hypothetical protein [Methylorubrum zatmanii]
MLSALTSFAITFLVRLAMDAFTFWRAQQEAKAAGRAEARADGEREARASVNTAREAEAEAAAAHRAHDDDAAFDQSFRRD